MQKFYITIIQITLVFSILIAGFPIIKASQGAIASLAFDGTTATCSVNVSAAKVTDKIVVSVKLYQGKTLIAEWNDMSNHGKFTFSDTATVKKGKTYTMKTECSINGKSQSIASITKKCK